MQWVSKPLSIYVDLFDRDIEKNKFVIGKIKDNFDLSQEVFENVRTK